MEFISRSDIGRLGPISLSSKSQETIPTGITSLDSILGGGFPIGSVVLIVADEFRVFSTTFLKYFLAQGIASNDSIFIASRDVDPKKLIADLPPAVHKKEEVQESSLEEMKIAFRYQSIQPIQSIPGASKVHVLSNEFDFSSKVFEDVLKNSELVYWPENVLLPGNLNSLYHDISNYVSSKGLLVGNESKTTQRKVSRISIQNLGSPFWSDEKTDIYKFLYNLRTIVHNSYSVAMVTVSSQLLNKLILSRCEQLSDCVIVLNSLINTNNPLYSDFSGLLKFVKLSPINSLSAHIPEDSEWAFKIKKKKLIIEKFHLPPEASVTDQSDIVKTARPNCQLQF